MIHGFSQFCKAVTKIVGSLIGGGAITVGSGGMLSVGGVTVAIAEVTAGAVEVTYGGKVITKSASNLGNDVKRFAELSKEKPNSTKSYIKHDTYNLIRNKLGKEAADKFTDAMNKGLVSGSGVVSQRLGSVKLPSL